MYAAVSAACRKNEFSDWKSATIGGAGRTRVADQIVELDGCDTSIHTTDDFLGNLDRINMHGVKTITKSRDTRCDLVKLDALLATI